MHQLRVISCYTVMRRLQKYISSVHNFRMFLGGIYLNHCVEVDLCAVAYVIEIREIFQVAVLDYIYTFNIYTN